jgi:superfamily II DNA or RNA helicase
VLPTGGGKTFTAVRFLCRAPLSAGYKVLWLAHTHHLLEQAYDSFAPRDLLKANALGYEVGMIAEPKSALNIRVVSSTPGHFPLSTVKQTDDVLIVTLQTLVRAYEQRHPSLSKFLRAAGDNLFVVFDEAHHSPAPSYRRLITSLGESHKNMRLLGLTATPTYSDENKRGWLKKLFPQGIIYQVSAARLMADGILARPIAERCQTSVTPDFDEREYRQWLGTYRDLPESIVTHLAENRDRNTLIAETYVKNKKRYGKTIIFAERWYQCEQLREFLLKRKVRAGVVYSHVDAAETSVAGRNRRARDENARELEAFRRGELDVLINVKMLTEGTDVPDVNTVFLTRQTTSNILLTQMVGRALRGPKFGGTEYAYIVSFVDDWKQAINWAEYDQLGDAPAGEVDARRIKRPPLQLISIDLVRRLARQTDSGMNIAPAPFSTLMPLGWYRTEFDALVGGTDDIETIRNLVLVFEDDKAAYEKLIKHLKTQDLKSFSGESVDVGVAKPRVEEWIGLFFTFEEGRNHDELTKNLLDIARHMAQRDKEAPIFFSFEERAHHDLDKVAAKFIADDLGPRKVQQALEVEYARADRYWATIYPNFMLFKSQYDACLNRVLGLGAESAQPLARPDRSPEMIPDREPSEDVKRQVKERDNYRCLCCGETNKRLLHVDHVAPSYLGGNNSLSNLQTLCRTCNNVKGIGDLNFRAHKNSSMMRPPAVFPELEPPAHKAATDAGAWKQFLRRSFNFHYGCAAVSSVIIGGRGRTYYEWRVNLYADNDPRWVKPHLKPLLKKIRERICAARYDDCVVERLIVSAPGEPDVAHPAKSSWG